MDSEKAIEKELNKRVKAVGGLSIKMLAGHIAGLPDRLILLPKGILFFVEIKTTGCKPSLIQRAIHKRLIKLGFKVHVIDSFKKLNSII